MVYCVIVLFWVQCLCNSSMTQWLCFLVINLYVILVCIIGFQYYIFGFSCWCGVVILKE